MIDLKARDLPQLHAVSSRLAGLRFRLRIDIEPHGEKEDQALDRLLPIYAHAQNRHAIVEYRHHEAPNNGADDRSDAARGRCAADVAGGDGVQLEAGARLRRSRVEPARDDEA